MAATELGTIESGLVFSSSLCRESAISLAGEQADGRWGSRNPQPFVHLDKTGLYLQHSSVLQAQQKIYD